MPNPIMIPYRGTEITVNEAADIRGISPSTILTWMRKYGVKPEGVMDYTPRPRGDRNGKTPERVIPWDDEMITVMEAAARKGITTNTVRYWLRSCGVKPGDVQHRKTTGKRKYTRAPREIDTSRSSDHKEYSVADEMLARLREVTGGAYG